MDQHQNIGSIMTPDPICVETNLSIEEARKLMESKQVRQLPVTRQGQLAGVFTETNLRVAKSILFGSDLTVGHIMDVEPHTVRPNENAEKVLEDMLRLKLSYAVVVQESNQPIGIFTRQDILSRLLSQIRKGDRRVPDSDSNQEGEKAAS